MTSQRNCYKLHWCSQRCSWNSSLLKTLSKPLLLYKGPNLALALKVLILQYFHLSVTERDSPSSQISSLDGTSSSYPIYKPRTDPRLPVCRKLETGFLSCPHYACFVFFRKFVFLNCRRDSQYPKKNVFICDLCNHIEPIRTFKLYLLGLYWRVCDRENNLELC